VCVRVCSRVCACVCGSIYGGMRFADEDLSLRHSLGSVAMANAGSHALIPLLYPLLAFSAFLKACVLFVLSPSVV
jgi:hypothetical protein